MWRRHTGIGIVREHRRLWSIEEEEAEEMIGSMESARTITTHTAGSRSPPEFAVALVSKLLICSNVFRHGQIVRRDGRLVIQSVLPAGPSHRAGVKIGGEKLSCLSVEEAPTAEHLLLSEARDACCRQKKNVQSCSACRSLGLCRWYTGLQPGAARR